MKDGKPKLRWATKRLVHSGICDGVVYLRTLFPSAGAPRVAVYSQTCDVRICLTTLPHCHASFFRGACRIACQGVPWGNPMIRE